MAQRMKEVLVVDPLSAFHEIMVHDGDVRRCSAETDQAQPKPKSRRLSETRRGR